MLTQPFNSTHRTLFAITLLTLTATSAHSLAQSFTPLGPIPQGTSSTAKALSRDGTTIVGVGNVTVGNNTYPQPFRWTTAGGMTRLPSGQVASANGVSSDGLVVVGTSGVQAGFRPSFRWTAATGLQNTGTLPGGTYAYLEGCNADGSLITGVSYAPDAPNGRAVRWTMADGLTPLSIPVGDTFSAAPGITPDGAIIVGSSGTYAVVPPTSHAIRWNSSGVPEDLGVLPGASHSSAAAISDDGGTIVGASGNFYDPTGTSTIRAVRWTSWEGLRELNFPKIASRALGVSADGRVIVGTATFRTGPSAFLWTTQLGIVNLNKYLPVLGVDPSALKLQSAVGISADGRTITGTGLRPDTSLEEAWVATIPGALPPCLALAQIQRVPECPREHLTLSIASNVGTPYAYTWQVLRAPGQWVDLAGTIAMDCNAGIGGGGPGAVIVAPAAPDPASPTISVRLRPCHGFTSCTFRVLAYSDCAFQESEQASYSLCAADFDCNGVASILDIFAYLNAWMRGDDATDFDGSGPATITNLLAFLDAWFAGCF